VLNRPLDVQVMHVHLSAPLSDSCWRPRRGSQGPNA
jgi:hypothetical protein